MSSMHQLPKEVIGAIAAYLSVDTLLALAATHRRLRGIIVDNVALWRYHYERTYPLDTDTELAWLAGLAALASDTGRDHDALDWYRAYVYRHRTECNWRHGRFHEHIQQLPRLSQQRRYRLLGKSDWGAILLSEHDRRLFLIGGGIAAAHQQQQQQQQQQHRYWQELSITTLPDCVAYPEKAMVASHYVVVCGRVVYSHPAQRHRRPKPPATLGERLRRRLGGGSGGGGGSGAHDEEVTVDDTLRTWMSCLWVWRRGSGELLTTIHSPNTLQLQQLIGRWLLVRARYPTDDPHGGNSRYRVLDLRTSVWCTGELIAATGFCHLHIAPSEQAPIHADHHNSSDEDADATVTVFVGFETGMHGLTSAFRWQLLVLGRATPHILRSGYSPYWPMLVRKAGSSVRLDDAHVVLTVDFDRASTAQTYVGLLRLGCERLQWREPMHDTIVAWTPDRQHLLTTTGSGGGSISNHVNDDGRRRYTVRQLGRSDVVGEYRLTESSYRLHCLSRRLAYAYSPKTAGSMVLDVMTGETIHTIDPSGLTRCQMSFPSLGQLMLLHPYSGQLIVCDFVPR
ncbi:hypothetical protein SYNPS1DRAFT_26396 [Syncephalis pseudoplumigaleata]|uniref:F-box domain-containing protein n=1 Tax=Syncephalis pseudoplumigaleata TaxID=1712513 RepID=A0A4P9Z5S8_9FUNG|nr:hypothetical protein SYNPS1DRAFT_26396 [Syncephalis pseudoplumigaleata]|eukprot:RKP27987.1 hypothetical protein SYNPS1DRAFT_26396 [Syncephalis pseudoplumigaleata]